MLYVILKTAILVYEHEAGWTVALKTRPNSMGGSDRGDT